VTCYTRHLASVFAEAGIADSADRRRDADRVLRDLLGMRHAKCNDVWHELKGWLADPSMRAIVVEDLRRYSGVTRPTG
jgi:hypothetical protein